MTPQQLTTLKAAIEADSALNAEPMNSDGNFNIAVALNQTASPAFYVWRSSVSIDEIMNNGFEWSQVDNITAPKARIWEWMKQTGVINPSKANVRDGIQQAWATAAKDAQRLGIYSHCYKAATRAEKLFATGTGAASDKDGVGPASTALDGQLSASDVAQARA